MQTKFTLDNLGKFILDRHNLIDAAYYSDVYKYNSYGAYKNALTEYNLDEVSLAHSAYVLRINYPGIFPFIQSQREWAVKQIKAWDKECSIDDNTLYNLEVFPNPANDYVNVINNSSGFEFAQFKLYDFTGRICLNTQFILMQGKYFTLPLEAIPTGIYFLHKISADGKIGRAKIIIK